MKKLSVLLVAAAVALSASAGVNNRIDNTMSKKVSVKELKANAGVRENMSFKRGGIQTISPVQLKAMDWQVRPASNMFRGENDIVWDFEDEAQLEGWMILDNDGDGYCWEYVNNTGLETGRFNTHSGEGVMVSASYDNETLTALYPDNWLISPTVTLKKSVSLWASGQDASYAAERFAIYVCVGTPTSLDDFVKVGPDKVTTGSFVQYAFDLSEYEGQEGCIAIRHYNVSDMFYLNVDDITLSDEMVEPEPEPETPEIIYDVPADAELLTFMRKGQCIYNSWLFGIGMEPITGKMNVAISADGTKMYIQDPMYWFATGAWIVGDINGDNVTFPVGQYLQWSDSYMYGVQVMWGSSYVYTDTDENGEEGYYLGNEVDERAEEIAYNFDGTKLNIIGSEGDPTLEFPFNFEATGLYAMYSDDLTWAGALEFFPEDGFAQELVVVPAVPANPEVTEWYDGESEGGFSRLYFTLPTTDIDGNPIDQELLSYSIFLDDDQLFTFPYDTYYYNFDQFNITEDLTEIPYDLATSGYDFNLGYVYFYRTNAEGYEPFFTWRIGMQVYYTVDRERNASDIVYLEVFPRPTDAVNEINAGKTVANVRYFNVAGQEMAQPEGMTIAVTTYTDGTTSAVKVVK